MVQIPGSLVIASNRLPVTVSTEGGAVALERSSGGLVAALRGTADQHLWVGWPGTVVPEELEQPVTEALAGERCLPVFLDPDEERDFYGGMCNDALWPLFHYFVDRFRFSAEAWRSYVAVNERFAEALAGTCAPGARVWVHDFHLALVPAALRRRRPDVTIGFFLHIPFPSSELYRLLPTRGELLTGILGADYIGFHTADYVRHFRSSCLRVLGIDSGPESIEHDGREVGIGAHPIGVDGRSFRETLRDPANEAVRQELERRYRGKQLVLGVERLDYSKGIPQKLAAFERFLEEDPARAETTTMLQVVVPSRLQSAEYRAQRDEIEGLIAHVNGRFGQPGRTPIEYLYRSLSPAELAFLYRRADVMMVTPLRDGMNLVAQEFVLCQAVEPGIPGRWRGVLLLSELAGASHVLSSALLVNPWNAQELVDRLVEALAVQPAERRRRLDLMADRVDQLDATRWARGFLRRLEPYARRSPRRSLRLLDDGTRTRILRRAVRSRRRTLLLDYDGTLRELTEHPDLAVPTPEILQLLVDLAGLRATSVHLVSGRRHQTLAAWFGTLPIALCAEHGYLVREPGGAWQPVLDVDVSWLPRIERVLARVARDVPGTFVERKACGVAWHYRQAEPEYGKWRARELLDTLDKLLAGISAELLHGHRVVEVRARGVHKGAYVQRLFPDGTAPGEFVLAAGDDVTDLDLYRALPPGSFALHVGHGAGRLRSPGLPETHVIPSPSALRQLLRSLADDEGLRLPAKGRAPT